MKKQVKYVASGLVLGNLWGGGSGLYDMITIEAETKEELLQKAKDGIKDGTLDDGMGFEKLRGAVLDITVLTTIEVDGDEYVNTKYQFDSVGDLTDDELTNMERMLLNLEIE